MPRELRTRKRRARRISGPKAKQFYWSNEVTPHSSTLDLEAAVFTWDDPYRIARSLERSAEASTRRKGTSYQSAMSMLTFYINRAGSSLSDLRRRILEVAKGELRILYGRESTSRSMP
jgi:hypothetical protein